MDPSTFDPQTFDLGLILTAAGIPVAAGLIASLIQILKRVPVIGAWLDADHETAVAIVASAILVGYAAVAVHVPLSPTSGFMLFLAWLNLAGFVGKAYEVAPDGLKSALGGN